MTHFHLIAATKSDISVASVVYDNYEDSVDSWVKLCTMLFSKADINTGALAIENALAATGHGKGVLAVSGTDALCIYWMRCEDSCYSVTWN